MKKLTIALLVGILGLGFAISSYADHGGKGRGKAHEVNTVAIPAVATDIATVPDKRPPGWDRGKKTGWGASNVPPGLAKKGVVATPTTVTDRFLNWFGLAPAKNNVEPVMIVKPQGED